MWLDVKHLRLPAGLLRSLALVDRWWMSWPLSLATKKRAFGTSIARFSFAARKTDISLHVVPPAPAENR